MDYPYDSITGGPGQGRPAGTGNQIKVHNLVESKWPDGGYMVTRPLDERYYDVNQYSPVASSSTVQGGNWERGAIIRQYQPIVHPPMLGYTPYDPTDPTSWNGNAN